MKYPKLSKFKRNNIGRIGVIDIGSNSVRLVVFDGASRSPSYFFNEKIMCGLGVGLSKKLYLNPTGKKRALKAIKRFMNITKKMEISKIIGIATAAIRKAKDGNDFLQKIKDDTFLDVFIASGEEEARLSANGVLLGRPKTTGLVCDIGGGSLEFADLKNGKVLKCSTCDIGPLFLSSLNKNDTDLEKYINKSLLNIYKKYKWNNEQLFLVGGSCRAFAKIDMMLSDYPLKVINEYKISSADLIRTGMWIIKNSIFYLEKKTDISKDRLSLLPLTSIVLINLVNIFKIKTISFSSYGLREGILFDQMPEKIKKLNPLIEACRYQEKNEARTPGFGEALNSWIKPILSKKDCYDKNLVLSACLLHDTIWRTHPEFRADICYEIVTRANFSSIDHKERAFLVIALITRYKNSLEQEKFSDIVKIMDKEIYNFAIIVGQLMRLGSTFSGGIVENLNRSKLYFRNNQLFFLIKKNGHYLMGEAVEKRLSFLGKTLKLETEIKIKYEK
mgnify:CR=1 FL=1